MNVSIMHIDYFAYAIGGVAAHCCYSRIVGRGHHGIRTAVNIITLAQRRARGVCFSSMTVRP